MLSLAHDPVRFLRRLGPFIALLCLLIPNGCAPNRSAQTRAALPLEGITVRLLVIDDPQIAQAISLLRGQWQAETGAELVIEDKAETVRTAAAMKIDQASDVVIYPPQLLGAMAESGAIRKIGRQQLDSPELDWADVCELVKSRDVTWGGDVYAVPLGSPVLVCFYRQDLLEALGASRHEHGKSTGN